MKIKTQDLTGPALDWAVARALGLRPSMFIVQQTGDLAREHRYSRDWSQGGPIIEREGISLEWSGWGGDEQWLAYIKHDDEFKGPTPLIAAIRCYVASKLGDEVDIPEELL